MKDSKVLRFVLALVFLGAASSGFAATNPDLSGRVVFVDGDVTANGREAETGDLLTGAVVLKTGKASSIEMVFAENNIFRLGPNTVCKIDFSQLLKTVTLEKGEFTSVLKKLSQVTGGSSFLLKSPAVNAGVRGTSFYVSSDGTNSYVCICNGEIALDDGVAADDKVLQAAHHKATNYTRGANGKFTATEGVLQGHTDADMEALAQRIGAAIDWNVPDLRHE